MEQYTIYCTEGQTKKALELGALIDGISSSTNEDITTIHCFKLDTPIYTDVIEGGFDYALIPTAEQMIEYLLDTGKGNSVELGFLIQTHGYKQGCLTFIDSCLK